MPKLTIDNREVTVPEGTNVLEAARALDIVIPHFCYHEALGAVGSCRLCAMTFLEGPVEGIQMACMIEAQDGMVVSTTDKPAVELRRHMIEWSMINHPHDCPVCDEGGECQLQDMTVAGGHSRRRYRGKKRTFNNQDLGPFIAQEMNRCITCYRCVRTYRDYCGGTDFGVFGSRDRVSYGRFRPGRLESPFSGNLVDVCPTGVFTNKVFRYMSRVWDLQEAPSICPHCSLGCSVIPGGRYRELQRVRAGVNRTTNGFFICDRGRFGYGYVNHPERPRQARVDGEMANLDSALAEVAARIIDLTERYGPEGIAFVGSARASLESNALLADWAARVGSPHLLFETHRERDRTARILAARLDKRACSLAELKQSDLILLIGTDLLAEGPMAALAVRQAARAGARVVLIDPRPAVLPCDHTHLPAAPERLPMLLDALITRKTTSLDDAERAALTPLFEQLETASAPVLVGGADLLGSRGTEQLLTAAAAWDSEARAVRVIGLLAGPNSYGGALLTTTPHDFDSVIDAIQDGTVKALVCLESDPFRECYDPARAQAALGRLELLIAFDCTPSMAAQRADIFLPSRALTETAGSLVNHEGRLQAFEQVIEPGVPLRETSSGEHPPRTFSRETPGAQPRPAWQMLAQLLDLPVDLPAIRRNLAAKDVRFVGVTGLSAEQTGPRISGTVVLPQAAPDELPHCVPGETLPLLPVRGFAGSDWLSHLSAPLRQLEETPAVWLHPELAKRLNLTAKERVRLTTPLGHCHVEVRIAARMANHLVVVPYLLGTALESLVPGGRRIDCRLDKEVRA